MLLRWRPRHFWLPCGEVPTEGLAMLSSVVAEVGKFSGIHAHRRATVFFAPLGAETFRRKNDDLSHIYNLI